MATSSDTHPLVSESDPSSSIHDRTSDIHPADYPASTTHHRAVHNSVTFSAATASPSLTPSPPPYKHYRDASRMLEQRGISIAPTPSPLDQDSDLTDDDESRQLRRSGHHRRGFSRVRSSLSSHSSSASSSRACCCCRRLRTCCTFTEGSIALFLILSLLLLLLFSILIGLLFRPWFTIGMVLAFGVSLGFLLTESNAASSWMWHHNRESENRFWVMVSIVCTVTLLFTPDSPFAFLGRSCPFFGICFVTSTAIFVHLYDRYLKSRELSTAPKHMRRVSSFVLSNREVTKQKLQVVQDCLAALDFRFVAAKAMNQSAIIQAEVDIFQTLSGCASDELNYVVTNVNLPFLFYKVKDRDIMMLRSKGSSGANRTKILHLLARERLPELNVQARVAVLDALMTLRLKAHTNAEAWVRDIILGTHGRMLTRMKNACDLKGRIHSFHKLIYRDIADASIRSEILRHISLEGEVVKTDNFLPKDRRKILSDVDDTLFSSGGKFPAGVDRRYPHHVLYPGVCSFYRELDLGRYAESGEWEEGRQGNLAFLSARPQMIERQSYEKFEQLRMELDSSMRNMKSSMGLHCVPTLLSGSLDSGLHSFRGVFEPMSAKKLQNFMQYSTLYPEYKFCFIGDNGQGDPRAGELMKDALGSQVEAIFIHKVQPIHRTPGYPSWQAIQTLQQKDVVFFSTYIGAAVEAFKRNMIHPQGLKRIMVDASCYFIELRPSLRTRLLQSASKRTNNNPVLLQEQYHLAQAHLESLRQELNIDMESANELLVSYGLEALPWIPAECLYHVGSSVETPWGVGIVERFDPSYGIYTVALTSWMLNGVNAAVANHPSITCAPSLAPCARAYVHGRDLSFHTKGMPGDAVLTRFGTGILQQIREESGIHVVKLTEWGHAASLVPLVPNPSGAAAAAANVRTRAPTAYLQADAIQLINAAVGDHVRTQFGIGVVIGYRPAAADSCTPAIYTVRLAWHDGGGAIAYLNSRSIRKIRDTSQKGRCVVM